MDNGEIAAALRRLAIYNDLAGENPFKGRAFERAARSVERLEEPVTTLAAEDRLAGIDGIGAGIARVIRQFAERGSSTELEELAARFPPGLTDLLAVQGMGAKRVKAVWERLGVTSVEALEQACAAGRVASLAGFGERMQEKILESIRFLRSSAGQCLLSDALAIAGELTARVKESGLAARVDIAGSLRRGKDVFKDIDILTVPVDEAAAAALADLIASLADEGGLIGAGPTKVSIRYRGLQVDNRIVAAPSWPAALQYFTGSRDHNIALRGRSKGYGLKINEYGVWDAAGKARELRGEEDVYGSVGLPWIAPELRESAGEIEAAERGELPRLVELRDLQGAVHAHSTWSDGRCSIEEMARDCVRRGYRWLCLSDHSRSAAYAGGLSVERLREQAAEVSSLNRALAPFRIFHGVESDILGDGRLDYPDDVLEALDFVIGSVHAKLAMGRDEATARLTTAIANPRLTMLGHPGGGLLLERPGYAWDEGRILEALASSGAVLEHNCNPHRLDPGWQTLRKARSRGVPVAICPDAHDLAGLDDVRFGVIMARKAWLGPDDIINCRSVEEIDAFFQARKRRG